MKFNKKYTEYWKERIDTLSDGTKIADIIVASKYASFLEIKKTDIVLDIGCSYGRFFSMLSSENNQVWGIDIEGSAIEQCKNIGYSKLAIGKMEAMPFATNSVDKVFCWATFDCTEQENALAELARILRLGGKALITGKNIEYCEDDDIAFIAERNARLKGFPNHFTDLNVLIHEGAQIGLSVKKIFRFLKRGDLGLDMPTGENADQSFYEYIILVERIQGVKPVSMGKFQVCTRFSRVAKRKAEKAGYDSIDNFFKAHASYESKS